MSKNSRTQRGRRGLSRGKGSSKNDSMTTMDRAAAAGRREPAPSLMVDVVKEPANVTAAWLQVIQQATAVLHEEARQSPSPSWQHRGGGSPTIRHRQQQRTNTANKKSLFHQLKMSMDYLNKLERRLQAQEDWDEPPTQYPPKFRYNKNASPTGVVIGESEFSKAGAPWGRFDFPDDYSDSSSEDDKSISQEDLHVAPPQDRPGAPSLSIRRLLIRIVTSQSELYACRASHLPPQWKEGATCYEVSLQKIHSALQLADSECANQIMLHGQVSPELQEDAQIVSIAIAYLNTECDKFRQAVSSLEQYLLQRLRPQWEAREAVRASMGEERWKNNTHPHHRYAEMRKDDERELRVAQAALQQLDRLDTATAQVSAQELQARVLPENQSWSRQSATEDPENRYNGQRPSDLSRRVSFEDYPDPSAFGWIFTGSYNNCVEFYERANQSDVTFEEDVVKMDWYFTTAIIKTSLYNPSHGKTALFGKRVSPEVYHQVLMNPRAHANFH